MTANRNRWLTAVLLQRGQDLFRPTRPGRVGLAPPGRRRPSTRVRLDTMARGPGSAGPKSVSTRSTISRATRTHIHDVWTDGGRWFAPDSTHELPTGDRTRSRSSPCSEIVPQRRVSKRPHDQRNAALLGSAVGVTFTVCFVTGLYSALRTAPSGLVSRSHPAQPGSIAVTRRRPRRHRTCRQYSLLLVKLRTAYPKLFTWPPFSSIANAVEQPSRSSPRRRSAVFLLFTGLGQHQPLVSLEVQLSNRALLGGLDHYRRAHRAHRRQVVDQRGARPRHGDTSDRRVDTRRVGPCQVSSGVASSAHFSRPAPS